MLTASLTLNGDLFCASGTALTIAAKSVVLDLAGHQIDGESGAGDGVNVESSSDTVENGVISNFLYYGVFVGRGAASDTVSAVRAVGNEEGFDDWGTNNTITNNTAAGGTYGIVSIGSGGTYSGDHELNNGATGLYLAGSKTVASGNVADGNTVYGIWDDGANGSRGTTLTKNTADFNGNDGIYIQNDSTVIDGSGNLAKGNDYTAGTTPEQCNGVVCT